jgi:hypothetical protein
MFRIYNFRFVSDFVLRISNLLLGSRCLLRLLGDLGSEIKDLASIVPSAAHTNCVSLVTCTTICTCRSAPC